MASWLIQNGIVTAVMALLVWGICRWGRLGPVARHALWLVVLVKLMIPPMVAWPWAVEDPLGGSVMVAEGGRGGPMELLRALLRGEEAVSGGGGAASLKPSVDTASSASAPGGGGVAVLNSTANASRVEGHREEVTLAAKGWSTARLFRVVIAFWFLGVVVYVAVQCVRIFRMIRWARRGGAGEEVEALERVVGEVAGRLGMRRVRVRVVRDLGMPYVWALFGPVLLWPAGMGCEGGASRALIVHELAHVKRRDHWVGWMMLAAGSVWWWNPVYWLVCRELRENAELACDGWVVGTMPERRVYAEALLAVCERGLSGRGPLAMGIGDGGKRMMERRLRMIMGGRVTVRLPRVGWVVVGVVMAASLPTCTQGGVRSGGAMRLAFTVSKETTGITSPLNADGTPDYVGALNARYSAGVTPENNGFVAWLGIAGTRQEDGTIAGRVRDRVLEMSGARPTAEGAEVWRALTFYLVDRKDLSDVRRDEIGNEMERGRLEFWKRGEKPEFAEYLALNEGWLDKIGEAAAKPRWWSPLVSGVGSRQVMPAVFLPSLGKMREAAGILAARATLRAGAGDFEGFVRDVMTIKRLSRLLMHAPTIIEGMLGNAINRLGDDALGTVVGSGRLSAGQCDELREKLEALPARGDVAEAVELEGWSLRDTMIWSMQDGKPGLMTMLMEQMYPKEEGLKAKFGTIERNEVDLDVMLKLVDQVTKVKLASARAETLVEMRKLSAENDARIEDWTRELNASSDLGKKWGESRERYSARVGRAILGIMTPNLNRVAEGRRAEAVRDELAEVLLAAAMERARTGGWPGSLESMAPGAIAGVPRDFFSVGGKEPVKWVVGGRGARVYSVGKNGVDDGGRFEPAKMVDDIVVGWQE